MVGTQIGPGDVHLHHKTDQTEHTTKNAIQLPRHHETVLDTLHVIEWAAE